MPSEMVAERLAENSAAPKILVVEDNRLNMKLVTDLLESEAFQVFQAFDGKEGLRMLELQDVDLVLLDISLPDMSGYEVFEKIRLLPMRHYPKVVACTAQALIEEQRKIMEAGFDAYISKPIDISRFITDIRRLLS